MGQKPLEMDCFLSYKYSQLSGAMGFTTTDLTNCDRKILGRKIACVPRVVRDTFPCPYSLSSRVLTALSTAFAAFAKDAWKAVGRLYANTKPLHRRDLNADFVIHVGPGTNTLEYEETDWMQLTA